ncbi:GNAT family N-acetyltransferase [Pedobacter xixiisoli]|uniref:FR47-like protein n=1 Tax=Pedobacter xixiisoli TaxID=1476464 RepID=A0A285ZSK2_9SPHI|nr:GNAT family N-acetyltransferase [Pedobacter xixiisoli]SOD12640.1 FR47-like protein [Pedobacter xixiisoli]
MTTKYPRLDQTIINKLDNPVWSSLAETHQQHCLNLGGFRFFNPEYCPFGTFLEQKVDLKALEDYAELANKFFVVGNKPDARPENIKLVGELVCDQMLLLQHASVDFKDEIVLLNENHQKELTDLVTLVMPGYYRSKTSLLGNYYGIFKDNKLVAVTGERMAINGATEVSAVVTHPQHLGNGYAKQLVAHVANGILNEEKLPFLHVAATNMGAIKLYEKLGFTFRRKISFWNYEKL